MEHPGSKAVKFILVKIAFRSVEAVLLSATVLPKQHMSRAESENMIVTEKRQGELLPGNGVNLSFAIEYAGGKNVF